MIISDSRKYLLLHVPKTGGSSIKKALTPLLRGNDRDVIVQPRIMLMRAPGGKTAYQAQARGQGGELGPRRILDWPAGTLRAQEPVRLVKHATLAEAGEILDPGFLAGLKKVIVVRNPFARLYSAYNFRLRVIKGQNKTRDPLIGKDGALIGLEDFLESELCLNILASRPQADWIDGASADFTLRTETLTGDIATILPQLGYDEEAVAKVSAAMSDKRWNVSTAQDQWKGMSDGARDMIRTLYSGDFSMFGYDPDSLD